MRRTTIRSALIAHIHKYPTRALVIERIERVLIARRVPITSDLAIVQNRIVCTDIATRGRTTISLLVVLEVLREHSLSLKCGCRGAAAWVVSRCERVRR